jgi:hypothetical protein
VPQYLRFRLEWYFSMGAIWKPGDTLSVNSAADKIALGGKLRGPRHLDGGIQRQ